MQSSLQRSAPRGSRFAELSRFLAGLARPAGANAGYRADIDGLRAVAVLSVMAYHLGFRPVAGGFVGVDVFFVISGYLIGAMVFAEVEAEKFSFSRFYVRRIRRLFPALFTMLAVTALLSAVVLYPASYVEFARSLTAAVTSTSNIYFWLTADYFNTASLTNPLLHTWSLSVEEQFYLVFPMIALAAARYAPKHVNLIIVLIGVASLAASIFSTIYEPEAAFYLLHTRAWELALGIGLTRLPELKWSVLTRSLVAAIGMALIVATVFVAQNESVSFAPIPACIGAAMIILAGRGGENLIGAILAWPPIVFIGLLSYSLYLWHWPIIVLYQYRLGEGFLELGEKFEVTILIFAISMLSWYIIERPLRRGKAGPRAVFSLAAASAAVAVVAGVTLVSLQGLPNRFDPSVVRVASYLSYNGAHGEADDACLLNGRGQTFAHYNRALCLNLATNKPNILLVGDSHAANLRFGLDATLHNVNILQATGTQCRPVLTRQPGGAMVCRQLMDFLYGDFLQHHRIDLMVLAGRWRQSDLVPLEQTLQWIRARNIQIVVIGPFPRYSGALPQLVALARQYNEPDLPDRRLQPDVPGVDRDMRAMTARLGVRYVSSYDVFCHDGHCMHLNAADVPVQHDYGHLTHDGSLMLVRRLNSEGAFDLGAASRQTPLQAGVRP